MNPSVSNWDDEYARLARVASQLRSNHGGNQQQQQSVLTGLDRLKSQLDSTLSRMIPPADVSRRRVLIDNLSRQINNNGGGGDADLLGYSSSSQQTNQQQQQPPSSMSLSAQALRRQDDMIDELAGGVARLKDQTQLIHEETGLQNRLIDDMGHDVELAQAGIEAETARALKLKEDRSVWRLYCIIMGLTILLFWLIITGIS